MGLCLSSACAAATGSERSPCEAAAGNSAAQTSLLFPTAHPTPTTLHRFQLVPLPTRASFQIERLAPLPANQQIKTSRVIQRVCCHCSLERQKEETESSNTWASHLILSVIPGKGWAERENRGSLKPMILRSRVQCLPGRRSEEARLQNTFQSETRSIRIAFPVSACILYGMYHRVEPTAE